MTRNIVSIYYHYIKLPKRSHSHYQDCVNTRHKRYEKYDVGTLFLINSLLSLCEIKFSWIEGKGNRVLFHSLNITIPIILWIFFFLYLLFPIDLRTIQIFTQASAFNLLEIYKTDQSAISLSWNCEVLFPSFNGENTMIVTGNETRNFLCLVVLCERPRIRAVNSQRPKSPVFFFFIVGRAMLPA